LIGSNIRKEQPLLATRLRMAAKNGASINAINNTKYDFAMPLQANIAASPADLVATLARLTVIVAQQKQSSIDDSVAQLAKAISANQELEGLAESLIKAGDKGQIIIGSMAQMDANYSLLVSLATTIGNMTDAKTGRLEEGNAVAAWQSSFLPFADENKAKNASEMLDQPLKACLLLNIEPSLDSKAGNKAVDALREAGMVIHIGAYRSEEIEDIAHIMLPMAAVAESDGTHVNCEGVNQSWKAAIHPVGEARPGWKILRVMANYLDLDGFDYLSCESIRDENETSGNLKKDSASSDLGALSIVEENKLACIVHLPLYRADTVTRRSLALQQTQDNPPAAAGLHPDTLAVMKIEDGSSVELSNSDGKINITVFASDTIPLNCVLLPTAMQETAALGNANWLEVKSSA
jgi:NADH-quinone oxidoreductase subunit G